MWDAPRVVIMEDTPYPYPALLVAEATPEGDLYEVFTATHGLPVLLEKSSPRGVYKGTREEWLEAAAIIMGGLINHGMTLKNRSTCYRGKTSFKRNAVSFDRYLAHTFGGKPKDYHFKPDKVRYACSLQDTGMAASNALAHVHFAHATGNNHHEIRMGVHVGGRKLKDDSTRVADILLHEMIHTCAPRAGHGGAFNAICHQMGLSGKMTATVASDELRTVLWDKVTSCLGKYPHQAVKLIPRGQRGKGSRLIKVTCPECSFNMRTTRKWIIKAYEENDGLSCPIGHGHMIHPEFTLPEVMLG